MRKLVVSAFISLDGVMQAPGGPDEDRDGGFEFGGWTFPFFDDKVGEQMDEIFSEPFDLLLGRRTYEIFSGYWPKHEGKSQIADLFGKINKYVATRQAGYAHTWRHTHVLGRDAAAAIEALKREDGPNLMTQGSSDLIQTLLAAGLVDEIRALIFPVILGSGKRLFGDRIQPAGLKLTATSTSPSGVTVNKYVLDGPVKTGDFSE